MRENAWEYPHRAYAYRYGDTPGLQRLYLIAQPQVQLHDISIEGPNGEWVGRVRNVQTGEDQRPFRIEVALNRRVSVWVPAGDFRLDADDHILFTDLTREQLWYMPGARSRATPTTRRKARIDDLLVEEAGAARRRPFSFYAAAPAASTARPPASAMSLMNCVRSARWAKSRWKTSAVAIQNSASAAAAISVCQPIRSAPPRRSRTRSRRGRAGWGHVRRACDPARAWALRSC
ncbi:MAG: hypothetical protein WDM89_19255 [Rhizomicrobium sp.]